MRLRHYGKSKEGTNKSTIKGTHMQFHAFQDLIQWADELSAVMSDRKVSVCPRFTNTYQQ
jgi:hypothetical protein